MRNIVSNILSASPLDPGVGSNVKIQLFQYKFVLHIKLNGMLECSNLVANILPTDHPPDPWDWVNLLFQVGVRYCNCTDKLNIY